MLLSFLYDTTSAVTCYLERTVRNLKAISRNFRYVQYSCRLDFYKP